MACARTGFSLAGKARTPGATVVGSDTGAAITMVVREPALGLRGRPDYILEEGPPNDRLLIPVELKPTRRSKRVYESDELQLGAYLRRSVGLPGGGRPTVATYVTRQARSD